MVKLPSDLSKRTSCPIATGLDILGDKWTLLIIRDMVFFNKHKNKDFQNAGEGIPTNILADRLKQLEKNGLITKYPYQDNPPRYEYHLTNAGMGLVPVLNAIGKWSKTYVKGVKIPPNNNS